MKKVRSKLRPTEIGVIKTFSLSPDDEIGEIAVECTGCTFYYNNLAELCEKWEDYEGPKGCWIINILGIVEYTHFRNKNEAEMLREIGNRFATKEEAELAVRKLKAWKWLKDKGFRFTGCGHYHWTGEEWPHIAFSYPNFDGLFDDSETVANLDLLFGGEE